VIARLNFSPRWHLKQMPKRALGHHFKVSITTSARHFRTLLSFTIFIPYLRSLCSHTSTGSLFSHAMFTRYFRTLCSHVIFARFVSHNIYFRSLASATIFAHPFYMDVPCKCSRVILACYSRSLLSCTVFACDVRSH